jgi:HK97 family phage major capsid protein
MTLLEQREQLLSEYESFLDSGTFNAQKSTEYQARIARLDLKISEQRTSEVVDKSHRFGVVPGALPTPVIQGEVRGLMPEVAEKQLRAYDIFLRRGISAVKESAEYRTYSPLSVGSESLGQYLVPVTTGPEIEKKMRSSGQILTVCRDFNTTTGETVNWPTSDDTAEAGEFINENGAVGQSNPVFGHVQISSFQWDSKQVLVPLSLIEDSKFDVVGHLTECFGIRAGRGFSNRVVNDATDGLLASGNITGTMTSASATLLNYMEPLALQGKVDLAYNNENSAYAMSFATYLGYRALTSSTNVPLWDAAEARAGLLHGRKYVICNDLPTFGTTTNKYLVYGDFSKVIFRRVGSMSVFRFNELFMSNLQQGFQSYQRMASKVIQPSALAILKAA